MTELRDKVIEAILDAMDLEGSVSAPYVADRILAIPEIAEALAHYDLMWDALDRHG